MKQKTTFALCFANRSFMPGELICDARKELVEAVKKAGYDYIIMNDKLTRYGAVETREEGRLYHDFLERNRGKFDGVIFCMPIFADENGAVEALKDANVPILLHAYPDELGKLDFAHRRDAYCGKFSVTDVFTQCKIPFTVLKPHVVHPLDKKFEENLDEFAGICHVVNGMKRLTVGCIGARTTAFKTTRFDEITLQKYGITVESFDLSELIFKVQNMRMTKKVKDRISYLEDYSNCSTIPGKNLETLAKMSIVIDEYIEQYHLDCLTIRCWNEMETILRVCPCVLLSDLNNRKVPASCEIDLMSAITMKALTLASGEPSSVLDWNNNYGDDEDKVILFHCGPVASSLMCGKGKLTYHKMFEKQDPGSGWGVNEGRIKSFDMTFANAQTKDGKLLIYASEGKMTDDPVEDGFFGCAGVAKIDHLQDKLIKLARGGYKHHTAVGSNHTKSILKEAFTTYLHYEFEDIDGE